MKGIAPWQDDHALLAQTASIITPWQWVGLSNRYLCKYMSRKRSASEAQHSLLSLNPKLRFSTPLELAQLRTGIPLHHSDGRPSRLVLCPLLVLDHSCLASERLHYVAILFLQE